MDRGPYFHEAILAGYPDGTMKCGCMGRRRLKSGGSGGEGEQAFRHRGNSFTRIDTVRGRFVGCRKHAELRQDVAAGRLPDTARRER